MATDTKTSGLMIVAGSGAGLGHALLKRFTDGGYHAIGLARSAKPNLTGHVEMQKCDLADAAETQSVTAACIANDGIIDRAKSRARHARATDRMLATSDLADAYWSHVHQPQSAWTHELDIRPFSEKF